MSLSDIISVSGTSGLHKILTHTANGLIVESLIDGKRRPIYSTQKVSTLGDISIYTMEEDMPLKDVFKLIHEKESGKKGPDHKAKKAELRAYLKELVPNLDGERVYDSDISKLFQWYNLLVEKDMMSFEEEGDEKEDKPKKKSPAKQSAKTKPSAANSAGRATSKPAAKSVKTPSKTGRSSKKA